MSEPSAAWTSIEVSGPMKRSRAVEVGAEAHALLLDRRGSTGALARLPRRRLISSATEPWPIENTWKPPESVMIGRSQPMNSCSPPSSRDQLVPGLDEQVERVAEHHVVAELGDLGRVERLHGRLGGERHERRRAAPSPCGGRRARPRGRGAVAGARSRTGLASARASPAVRAGCTCRSSPRAAPRPAARARSGATSARMPPSRSSPTSRGHDQRHRVHRVRGVRAAVRLEHVVGVAVVGGDDAGAAGLRAPPRRPAPEALVDRLDRLHRGLDHAGVADHVRVGEVDDPEAEVAVAASAATKASAASRALISGFWS